MQNIQNYGREFAELHGFSILFEDMARKGKGDCDFPKERLNFCKSLTELSKKVLINAKSKQLRGYAIESIEYCLAQEKSLKNREALTNIRKQLTLAELTEEEECEKELKAKLYKAYKCYIKAIYAILHDNMELAFNEMCGGNEIMNNAFEKENGSEIQNLASAIEENIKIFLTRKPKSVNKSNVCRGKFS